jgi:hypothetical protein
MVKASTQIWPGDGAIQERAPSLAVLLSVNFGRPEKSSRLDHDALYYDSAKGGEGFPIQSEIRIEPHSCDVFIFKDEFSIRNVKEFSQERLPFAIYLFVRFEGASAPGRVRSSIRHHRDE